MKAPFAPAWPMLSIAVVLMTAIAAVVFAGRRSRWHREHESLGLRGAWFWRPLACGGVAAVVLGTSVIRELRTVQSPRPLVAAGTLESPESKQQIPQANSMSQPPLRLASMAADSGELSPESAAIKPSASVIVNRSELPEWTRHAARVDGASRIVVVRSGLWSSITEAELHGLEEAARVAAVEFRHLDPLGVGDHRVLQTDALRQLGVRKRFHEVSELELANSQTQMHQLWLQLELTPELGQRLSVPWKKAAIDQRLRKLAGWSLWSALMAGVVAFGLRLDSIWNGRRRGAIVGTTLVLMVGGLFVLL